MKRKQMGIYAGLLFGLMTTLSFASGHLPATATDRLLSRYQMAAEHLLTHIEKHSAPAVMRPIAQDLFALSIQIVQRGVSQVPQCRDYFSALLAAEDKFLSLSLAQLETDYHHDGALPIASVDCYHIKDLLVHPVAVLLLLQEDNVSAAVRQMMSAELDEVLEHIDLAARTLNASPQ